MATIQFENGTKVKFEGNPTPKDVEEVAAKLNMTGGAKSSASSVPKAPVLSATKQADAASAKQYGATIPANTEDPNALAEGGKVLANLPKSAFNFVKGAIDILNPVSTFGKLKQIGSEFGGLVKEAGGVGKAIGATAKELPGATYESLVPEAGRGLVTAAKGGFTGNSQLVDEGLKTAQRAIVNDPVGQIAPFLMVAKGGAAALDKYGVTKNASGAFDAGVTEVASPVTKAVSGVFSKAGEGVSQATRFTTGQATGLQPETISQITKTPSVFTKESVAKIDRASLGKEVQSTLAKKAKNLTTTGEEYAPYRQPTVAVNVDAGWLDSAIKENTGLTIKGKKLVTSGSAKLRDVSDVRAMQHLYDVWSPVFKKGKMTGEEFLNFRQDLAKLSKYERQIGKSLPIEDVTKVARRKFNESYRPQLSGLDKLDADFSARSGELKRLSKGFVDKDGNLTDSAINKIANATGKGKDLLISRLEETVPGITQKIKILKAVEDIQHASGIKVGTYGRAAIAGGAFFSGGPVAAAITAILTSPEMAVPILRRYGLIKNSAAISAVVKALKETGRTFNQLPNMTPSKQERK